MHEICVYLLSQCSLVMSSLSCSFLEIGLLIDLQTEKRMSKNNH